MNNFIFIANAAVGLGLSGSDRIFIELAKRWAKEGNQVTICVWEDGYQMCKREGLTEGIQNITFQKWFLGPLKNIPFIVNYFIRIISGIYFALFRKYNLDNENSYIYSCSDFWQDALPASILKVRYKKAKLIGSFYLTAPNPFVGFYEGERKQIPTVKSILYWLQQQPVKILFKNCADIMFVTSEPDAKKFKNSVVIRGGVNVEAAKAYQPTYSSQNKVYDAVFLGRFHPQKGVVELVEIWKKVVQQKNDAKLIMLGDGPLRSKVEEKIIENSLQNNIELKGYLFDGEEKYSIFRNSKVALHPAVYDSGGMASAEAMAWGIPAVSFDLEALKTYYPHGMIKIPFGELDTFAEGILELLSNEELYKQTARKARDLVMTQWDWDKRAELILKQVSSYA
jgi:glycosyltransferase involved in cell wall biosynthesis